MIKFTNKLNELLDLRSKVPTERWKKIVCDEDLGLYGICAEHDNDLVLLDGTEEDVDFVVAARNIFDQLIEELDDLRIKLKASEGECAAWEKTAADRMTPELSAIAKQRDEAYDRITELKHENIIIKTELAKLREDIKPWKKIFIKASEAHYMKDKTDDDIMNFIRELIQTEQVAKDWDGTHKWRKK